MIWIRLSGWLFVVLAGVTATVMIMGGRLPTLQHGEATGVVGGSAQEVWQRLTAVGGEPRWRPEVRAVEPAAAQGGLPCWREQQGRFAVLECAVVAEAPRLWVVEVRDPRLPFGGTRRYELTPVAASQTRVTVMDDATAGPEMWRFARHFLRKPGDAAAQAVRELQESFAGAAGAPSR